MNAGILTLKDGTPCIAYDEKLPFAIKYIEFSRADFTLSIVYDAPGTSKMFAQKALKFPTPLSHNFLEKLEDRGNIAVARVDKGQLVEIKLCSVRFKGKE